jgi:hypothetical protein
MRIVLLAMFSLMAVSAFGQSEQMRVGEIEFFGYHGLDIDRVRASLPIKEGDKITRASSVQVRPQIEKSVRQVIGRDPTDVAFLCCNTQGHVIIYVGLPGLSLSFRYNPKPNGSIELPSQVVSLYDQMDQLLAEAVLKQPQDDRSQGFSLSQFPPLRAKQLAMREFAVNSGDLIQRVLASSAEPKQRQVAAAALGYTLRSPHQIRALVRASRDINDGVRNNAIRALGVLAASNNRSAAQIPSASFVDMLNSGVWTDRNKAGLLLEVLSVRRDPKLMSELRSRALDSLIEMARWRDPAHASNARIILGRVAGIEEKRLQKLVAGGEVDAIVSSLE